MPDNEVGIESKVDQLIQTARDVKRSLNIRTAGLVALLTVLAFFGYSNRTNTTATKMNTSLLVECTTPGTNPNPKSANDTGNACWDRLHNPDGGNTAVALIVDDLYCDQRRAQHKLNAVPDPTKSCRSQTPADVYPGS